VCSKNSAPLSPTVSAASAGALELMVTSSDGSTIDDETLQRQILYSTSNLPKTLSLANAHGCRIVGASSSVPTTKSSHDADIVQLYNLQDLPPLDDSSSCPTLLVLGSEGHGLRSLVALACTEFVRIPGGGGSGSDESETDATTDGGVDSLNVSVTGGILLWHFLRPSTMQSSLPPLT
jgi:21S rRNA (GM2251-2'-O)-methyltransferase